MQHEINNRLKLLDHWSVSVLPLWDHYYTGKVCAVYAKQEEGYVLAFKSTEGPAMIIFPDVEVKSSPRYKGMNQLEPLIKMLQNHACYRALELLLGNQFFINIMKEINISPISSTHSDTNTTRVTFHQLTHIPRCKSN